MPCDFNTNEESESEHSTPTATPWEHLFPTALHRKTALRVQAPTVIQRAKSPDCLPRRPLSPMLVMSESTNILSSHQKPQDSGVDSFQYQSTYMPRKNTSCIRSQSEPGPYESSTTYSTAMGSGDEECSDYTTEPSRSPPSFTETSVTRMTSLYSSGPLATSHAGSLSNSRPNSVPDRKTGSHRQNQRRQRNTTPKGSKPFARKSKTGHSHFVTPAGASQGFQCTFIENGHPCQASTFDLPSQIRDHLIQEHMRFSPFQCSHCKRVFTRLSLLTRHLVKNENSEERTCPNDPLPDDPQFISRTHVKEALWAIQLRQNQVERAVELIGQYNGILDEKRKRAFASTSISERSTVSTSRERTPSSHSPGLSQYSTPTTHPISYPMPDPHEPGSYYGHTSVTFDIHDRNGVPPARMHQERVYPVRSQDQSYTLRPIESGLEFKKENPSGQDPFNTQHPSSVYNQQSRPIPGPLYLDERNNLPLSDTVQSWPESINGHRLWPQLHSQLGEYDREVHEQRDKQRHIDHCVT